MFWNFRTPVYAIKTLKNGNYYQEFLMGKFCMKTNITSGYENFMEFTVQPKVVTAISVLIYGLFITFFLHSSLKAK